PDVADGAVERLYAEAVPLGELVGHVADDERPRHVRTARGLGVARPEVDHDRLTGLEPAGAHVVPDRGLRSVRDDELVGARAVLEEGLGDRRPDPLGRQRPTVRLEPLAVLLRAAEEDARGGHPRLRGGLCTPDALQLGGALDAAPPDEEARVGDDVDAPRA